MQVIKCTSANEKLQFMLNSKIGHYLKTQSYNSNNPTMQEIISYLNLSLFPPKHDQFMLTLEIQNELQIAMIDHWLATNLM